MKLLGILILISFSSAGQVNDSLLYQLMHIEKDTERVNQLYKAGFDRRNHDPELSYHFAVACEKEALKTNSPKHLAKSYNLLGVLYYKKGDLTKALKFQKQALELNESIDDAFGIAVNQTNLGNIYSDARYYTLAEPSYLQALQAYNKMNNTLQMARCLLNIGVLKHTQHQFDAAIMQFKEALKYASETGDYDLIASCQHNIGSVLTDQNLLDTALVYLEEGLKIRSMMENQFELADSYLSIAFIYLKQNNFNQASNYLMLAENVCDQFDYAEARTELYHTRSLLYESQKNYEQANAWLKKHYVLKDSLQTIQKDEEQLVLAENEAIKDRNFKPVINNVWLLVVTGLLIIFIPLFLIRYKR